MIKDNDLEGIMAAMKEVITHYRTTVYINHARVKIKAVPTYVPLEYKSSYIQTYKDKRIYPRITWIYNPRQLTLSFVDLLHELGHVFNLECPIDREPRNDKHGCLIFEEELEAWAWARSKWGLVPLRTRYPSWYEVYCLQTYDVHDPYISTDYISLMETIYAEEKSIRRFDIKEDQFDRYISGEEVSYQSC